MRVRLAVRFYFRETVVFLSLLRNVIFSNIFVAGLIPFKQIVPQSIQGLFLEQRNQLNFHCPFHVTYYECNTFEDAFKS